VVVNLPEECAISLFHTNRDTTTEAKHVGGLDFMFPAAEITDGFLPNEWRNVRRSVRRRR
jgi:hypothetical protein